MTTQILGDVKPFVKQIFTEGSKVTLNGTSFTVVKSEDGSWGLRGSRGSLYTLKGEVDGTDASIFRVFSAKNDVEYRDKEGKHARFLILGVEMIEV